MRDGTETTTDMEEGIGTRAFTDGGCKTAGAEKGCGGMRETGTEGVAEVGWGDVRIAFDALLVGKGMTGTGVVGGGGKSVCFDQGVFEIG